MKGGNMSKSPNREGKQLFITLLVGILIGWLVLGHTREEPPYRIWRDDAYSLNVIQKEEGNIYRFGYNGEGEYKFLALLENKEKGGGMAPEKDKEEKIELMQRLKVFFDTATEEQQVALIEELKDILKLKE